MMVPAFLISQTSQRSHFLIQRDHFSISSLFDDPSLKQSFRDSFFDQVKTKLALTNGGERQDELGSEEELRARLDLRKLTSGLEGSIETAR